MNTKNKLARKSKLSDSKWEKAVESLLQAGPLPNYKKLLEDTTPAGSNETAARIYRDVSKAMTSVIGKFRFAEAPFRGNQFKNGLYSVENEQGLRHSGRAYVEYRDLNYSGYVAALICSIESQKKHRWSIYDSRFTVIRKHASNHRIEDVLHSPVLDMIKNDVGDLATRLVTCLGQTTPGDGVTLANTLTEAGAKWFYPMEDEKMNTALGLKRSISARKNAIDKAFKALREDLIASEIFSGKNKTKNSEINDKYVQFCVLKHILKLGRPPFKTAGEVGRQTRTDQRMVEEVMAALKKSVLKSQRQPRKKAERNDKTHNIPYI